MAEKSQLAIGIDGGGTKTVAWLGRHTTDIEILGVGHSGPSNPLAVGFEVACENLRLAIKGAFSEANLQPCVVEQACFCLAGAGRREEQEKLVNWARKNSIALHPHVIHDGEALLAAANLEHGITLIAGTGSLAWGKNRDGKQARSGGWGYLLDDVGGGYWIGLEMLKAVGRAADFRGPKTELTEAVFNRFGLQDVAQIKPLVYSHPLAKQKIAELAVDVFAAAQRCPVAATIISDGAQELVKLVEAVTVQLRCLSSDEQLSPFELAMGGTVLTKQAEYCDSVVQQLRHRELIRGQVTVVDRPVYGALRLALSRRIGSGGGQQ